MDKFLESRQRSKRVIKWVGILSLIASLLFLLLICLSSIPIGGHGRAAREANIVISHLSLSISEYHAENLKLPLQDKYKEDADIPSDESLMTELCGFEKVNYFIYHKNAEGQKGDYWNGLHRTQTTAQFFGPWKNNNIEDRYYHVIFDYDGDGKIREPEEIGGEIISDIQFLIYHKGKDGKIGGKYNDDNVYGWKMN